LTLYLDASVIVPLVIVEPLTALITAWLETSNEALCVSRLAIAETGSAISRRRRMRDISDDDGERALATLDRWLAATVAIADHQAGDIVEAGKLVRRPLPKLLTPDAIHLATCRRLGHRLVTNDNDLVVVADLLGIDHVMPR
jgi:predicted nucleic acid-binding protein